MVCFCCFDCCMPSKDPNTQFARRESAGCFHCSFLSSEWKARKREDRGIGCLCLGEPSSSSSNVDSPQKSRCFSCKKSLKKDMNGEGEAKEKKLFNCFKSTKKERKVRKGPSRGIECLCCGECFSKDGSPKSKSCCFSCKKLLKKEEKDKKCFSCFRLFKEVEERSSERGNSCMCFRASSMKDESSKKQGCQCLPHKKSSKEHIEPIGGTNKGCFSCFRSSIKEGDEKKSCCKVGCFCCGKLSSKVEPSETSGCCCLSHKNSLKEYPKSRGKDMIGLCSFRSPKVDSSNKENVGTSCDNEISKEDSPKKEGGTTCFSCRTGTSKANLSKKVGGICFCFKCHSVKLLKDPVLVDTGKQKKKSKDDLLKKRRGKVMCCCILSSTESLVERKSTSKAKCTLSCFFCIQSKSYQKSSLNKRKWDLSSLHMKEQSQHGHYLAPTHTSSCISENDAKNRPQVKEILPFVDGNSAVQVFMYKEIVAATKNFSEDRLLGSGVFGRVYKGEFLGKNEVVTVKQLMGNENHISNEFLVDLVTLSLLHHPNLIKLLGYCAERDQMILVYEYMAFGSLQDHLFDIEPNAKLLDWPTRMKIAAGAAKGLEYLHDVANPPMIYQDMKASNILLDENYNPKLSDFGLEKPKRVMGTYGCCAPEYAFTRKLTKTTDVYSFGVLLLELITGRKAIDTTRKKNEQYLAHWAAPLFKDKRKLLAMADPLLNGNFPVKDLYQALAIANMCLQYEASSRPLMSDVVTAIEYLATPERVSSDPLEEPEVSQNTSDDEKPKLQSFHRNGPLRTSIASFETFQSISSDIESCGTPREGDDQDED